ncbi:hypothetical protein KABACHOK_02630 [Brevundimonas phage vB_BpoS-Kabachok]|uniref:Uncharacterized protein n=1 Tax=Brevundimonas phage vB_BpoS-Kabachok TaxID=2948600 RepID=A0A9E7MPP6_9CAUD|nr:hypothetical protein KABACHOK_02630 [Brevundimonas phage vB_BpoS-Kabachok]
MERFVVTVCPEEGRYTDHPFQRKGLAFAYAKRKLPVNCAPEITVEHQKQDADNPEWFGLNAWTFHANGDVEHTRL